MSEIKHKALLAMHHQGWNEMLTEKLQRAGYEVTTVASVDEMLNRMGIPSKSSTDY